MLNEEVPAWVVQRVLDHESVKVRYATMQRKTLPEYLDTSQHRITAAGTVSFHLVPAEPIGEHAAVVGRSGGSVRVQDA